ENILQNYDEFATLKALQQIDLSDPVAVEKFKAEHYVDDEKLAELQTIRLPADRKIQDYRSAYNGHCCKVSDEAAFCLIQRPYISKTLL
ncbi:hypothetical protein, partial [Escherichia coli]|uniref:hypothetical protein n=1 Tax=Escherichia coli TaxID=562 RepID=UPI00203F92B7